MKRLFSLLGRHDVISQKAELFKIAEPLYVASKSLRFGMYYVGFLGAHTAEYSVFQFTDDSEAPSSRLKLPRSFQSRVVWGYFWKRGFSGTVNTSSPHSLFVYS
jgi:hypothetical protein